MDPGPSAPPSKRPSPRVQRILKALKLRKAGVPVAEVPWQAYQLQNSEFDELQRWLKQDEDLWGYVEDKVRYDYDSERSCLVSRRPTVLHTVFMALVVTEIKNRIDDIVRNGDPASRIFAREILGMGSSNIDLLGTETQEGKPKMRRDPDYSFQHREARWAGVVLELCYPLKRRALPHLADDYLLETDGNIRILVGIDLDTYTKKGTISTWQPLFKKDDRGVIVELEAALVIDEEVFRDRYGNPNQDPESGLHLDLEDFGPTDLTVDLESEIPIFIDSATLCLFLARAEAAQLNMDEARGGIPYQPKSLKIRKRRREEMESNRETSAEVTAYDDVTSGDKATERESVVSRDIETESANVASESSPIKGEKAVSGDEEMPLRIPNPYEKSCEDIA